MPNFSSLAGLEVAEKFVVVGRVGLGGWVKHVTTMSTPVARAQSAQSARRVLTIIHPVCTDAESPSPQN